MAEQVHAERHEESCRVCICASKRLSQTWVSRNCALSKRWPALVASNKTWTELTTGTLHEVQLGPLTGELVADEDGLGRYLGVWCSCCHRVIPTLKRRGIRHSEQVIFSQAFPAWRTKSR